MSAGPVVLVGDVMTDILVRMAGPIRRGTDQRAQIMTLPGGSGANQAAWLASAGVPVRLAARVGAADRDALAAGFAAAGIEPRLSPDPENPTGALVCLVEPDGQRSFLSSRGANAALDAHALPPALLDGASALHISGYALLTEPSRAALVSLMAEARARNLPVSIDPGSSGFLAELTLPVFFEAIAGADALFPNEDEAALLAGSDDVSRQIASLHTHVPLVVLKRGGEGAIAAPRGAPPVFVAAPPGEVRDTTGAGDAFFAGFLAARRAGGDLEAALASGNAMAARAVARLGGRPAGPLSSAQPVA